MKRPMKWQRPIALAAMGLVWLGPTAPVGGQGLTDLNATVSGGARLTTSSGGSANLGLTTGLRVSGRAETRAYSVDGNAALGFTLNRNDTDISISGGLNARTEFKRTRLNAGLTFSHVPTSFEELDFSGSDIALINSEGTRTRYGLFANASHDLNALTVISGGLSYTHTDYDPVNTEQVPADQYALTMRVAHDLNRRTNIFADGRLGWFSSENLAKTESFSASASAGLNHELTALTSVRGSLGLSFVNTEETVGGLRISDWNTALLLDAGISHAYADGMINVGVSQNVTPGPAGELQVNSALTGSMTYALNERESLGLNGRISLLSDLGGGDDETILTLTPSYTIEVADGLDATASYVLQNSDDGTSHRFSFDVSRELRGLR